MWPVFVVQFNCEFLRSDGGGDLYVILLFLHQLFTIIYVLGPVKNLGITAFRAMFNLVNVASFLLQFNCGSLSNHRVGDLYVILLFLHQFFAIIYVLGPVRKLGITAFRRMFNLVNVASFRCTIQLRVFKK